MMAVVPLSFDSCREVVTCGDSRLLLVRYSATLTGILSAAALVDRRLAIYYILAPLLV